MKFACRFVALTDSPAAPLPDCSISRKISSKRLPSQSELRTTMAPDEVVLGTGMAALPSSLSSSGVYRHSVRLKVLYQSSWSKFTLVLDELGTV